MRACGLVAGAGQRVLDQVELMLIDDALGELPGVRRAERLTREDWQQLAAYSTAARGAAIGLGYEPPPPAQKLSDDALGALADSVPSEGGGARDLDGRALAARRRVLVARGDLTLLGIRLLRVLSVGEVAPPEACSLDSVPRRR